MKHEAWPPPEGWTEIVITWQTMLDRSDCNPKLIQQWCLQNVEGRWHLHGWKAIEGFAFRFEDSKDAMMFALKWQNI